MLARVSRCPSALVGAGGCWRALGGAGECGRVPTGASRRRGRAWGVGHCGVRPVAVPGLGVGAVVAAMEQVRRQAI